MVRKYLCTHLLRRPKFSRGPCAHLQEPHCGASQRSSVPGSCRDSQLCQGTLYNQIRSLVCKALGATRGTHLRDAYEATTSHNARAPIKLDLHASQRQLFHSSSPPVISPTAFPPSPPFPSDGRTHSFSSPLFPCFSLSPLSVATETTWRFRLTFFLTSQVKLRDTAAHDRAISFLVAPDIRTHR